MMEFEPKVFRTLVFVRHGQYSSDPEKLTRLGRNQARRTALAISLLNPTKIYCSTMPRAVETATFLGDRMNLAPIAKDIFREGMLPGTTGFKRLMMKGLSIKEKRELESKTKLARKNANLAFKALFKKPRTGQHTEVIVAHGNVIRHWVCKAMDIAEEKWLTMDVRHASLTTIRISKKGHITLLGFSDTGHLPVTMRTYV